jgi:hypothetical protein
LIVLPPVALQPVSPDEQDDEVVRNPAPWIVIRVPLAPDAGVIEVIVGTFELVWLIVIVIVASVVPVESMRFAVKVPYVAYECICVYEFELAVELHAEPLLLPSPKSMV